MPRVFISYSHDNEPHKRRVRALADRLRGDQVEVVIDQDKLPGGPDEGWTQWSQRQVRESQYVLIACTRRYRLIYEGNAPADDGCGVACEAQIIYEEIRAAKGSTAKYRPIVFAGVGSEDVPLALSGYHRFAVEQDAGYAALLAWLRGTAQPAPILAPATAPLAGWPAPNPAVSRPVLANRDEEFEIFERMITGQTQERILLLRGASGSGKTTLTTGLRRYARGLNVLSVHADLKGCPTPEATLALVKLQGDFDGVRTLYDLPAAWKKLGLPVLLSLDTFESASEELQKWTDWCLQALDTLPFVVAMISGQSIPDLNRCGWRTLAATRELKAIEQVAPWESYVRRNWPSARFDTKHIESLVFATQGDPAAIDALLPKLMMRLDLAAKAGGAV